MIILPEMNLDTLDMKMTKKKHHFPHDRNQSMQMFKHINKVEGVMNVLWQREGEKTR